MLVIQQTSLKDTYMSYKLYVTYICCIILKNTQIHYKPFRTYMYIQERSCCLLENQREDQKWSPIYIQQSIVFGHLLLRMHYLMAPTGLDLEEGSQRFTSFLVGLLVFRSRSVTYKSAGCVSLVQNVWMCQRVCTYSPTSIGSLCIFSCCFQQLLRIWFHLLSDSIY